jgi:DNA-directed RNA polymerase specialized sigma24 family protein
LTEENDAELVAKSLQGNEKAFRTLVETHQPIVYAAVRGVLGARDDVDDVVQDVFVKVYRALDRFRSDAKLSSWIYRIAKNEAIDAYRRTRHGQQSVDDMELAAPAGARPDEQFRQQEYRQHLEILGLPLGTVKSYIHRAKADLKRMMTEPGAGQNENLQTP